jgi:hypothetical protein
VAAVSAAAGQPQAGVNGSFMNWGEINDWGQIVGYSETDALDPNGSLPNSQDLLPRNAIVGSIYCWP